MPRHGPHSEETKAKMRAAWARRRGIVVLPKLETKHATAKNDWQMFLEAGQAFSVVNKMAKQFPHYQESHFFLELYQTKMHNLLEAATILFQGTVLNQTKK